LEFGVTAGQDSLLLLDAQGDYPLSTPETSELLAHTEAFQILF
jgi:hypothetical protein